mgnify:CR=1 FL=1
MDGSVKKRTKLKERTFCGREPRKYGEHSRQTCAPEMLGQVVLGRVM